MSFRLLALDIDGTLVDGESELRPRTREAVRRAHASGLRVVIATGRRWRRTRSVVEALGLRLPAVCLGGALVKDEHGATLAAATFAPGDFRAVAAVVRGHGQTVIVQRDESDGGADFAVDQSAAWNAVTTRYVERNRAWAELRPRLGEQARSDVLGVIAFDEREPLERAAAAIEARLPGRFTAHVMDARFVGGQACLQVVASRATKWSALQGIAAAEGVPHHAICAVGDDANDLDMIAAAGLGVAMGNARPEIRAAADWVTGRHDEDGVARVVERLLAAGRAAPPTVAPPGVGADDTLSAEEKRHAPEDPPSARTDRA